MKTRIFVIALFVAGSMGPGTFRALADLEVNAEISIHSSADFYQPLTPRGAWIEVGHYGRCWHPAGVVSGWRPYCHGEWVWTDCGWYWESDEPWAWACYHYGSWVFDSSYGWVWVPGVEWAPAWVNWRTGGDYIGWAPCGPSGFVVEPAFFVFVQNRHFHERIQPNTVIINNTTIINQTREIRSVSREERPVNGRKQMVVVNEGPGVAAVEKATGRKFAAKSVQKVQETTIRTAPAEIRHRTPSSKSAEPSQAKEPQTKALPRQDQNAPAETVVPRHKNEETPRTLPKHEVVPDNRSVPERAIPEEHKVAPKVPEKTIPERNVPNVVPEHNVPNQAIPERPVPKHMSPEVPAHKAVPPVNEIPRDKGIERPREIVPPTQSPHPVNPVAPGNMPPNEKGNNRGVDGNEHKDRQDHP